MQISYGYEVTAGVVQKHPGRETERRGRTLVKIECNQTDFTTGCAYASAEADGVLQCMEEREWYRYNFRQ